jgi:hypothetical protein
MAGIGDANSTGEIKILAAIGANHTSALGMVNHDIGQMGPYRGEVFFCVCHHAVSLS